MTCARAGLDPDGEGHASTGTPLGDRAVINDRYHAV
jgi:hypothetical protein